MITEETIRLRTERIIYLGSLISEGSLELKKGLIETILKLVSPRDPQEYRSLLAQIILDSITQDKKKHTEFMENMIKLSTDEMRKLY